MALIDLFPIRIFHGNLSQDFNIPSNLWDGCHEGAWSGETGQSTGEVDVFLHEREDSVRNLIDALFPSVLEYWEHLGYAPADIQPVSSWANNHRSGDYTREHSHSDGIRQSHISAVYYIEKCDGGDIEFVNPLDYIHRLTPRVGEVGDMLLSESVRTETWDFLLFPGWLRHRTQPTLHPRKAISINFTGFHAENRYKV